MRTSSRGEVDPFIVMDVMEAARAAEEAGRHIIHMEVGQPGTPAPRGRPRRAWSRRWRRGRSATPWRSACRRCARASRRLYGDWYGVDLDPGPGGRHRRLLGGLPARLHRAVRHRRPGRARRSRLSRPTARSCARSALSRSASRPAPENRYQPVPRRSAATGLAGLMLATPGNPTGTMLGAREMAALVDGGARRAGSR